MSSKFGTFSGEPETVWLTSPSGGLLMRLTTDFTFTHARDGRIWSAPRGLVLDGASIPRALWTVVGSPYTGDYRRASVVHDQACLDYPADGPERKAADVMFEAACRAGGCSALQAKVLYAGVRVGSRWSKSLLVERDEANAIWFDLPEEDEALRARFVAMGRELAVTEGLVEEDPETAVAEVDALLTAHGFL